MPNKEGKYYAAVRDGYSTDVSPLFDSPDKVRSWLLKKGIVDHGAKSKIYFLDARTLLLEHHQLRQNIVTGEIKTGNEWFKEYTAFMKNAGGSLNDRKNLLAWLNKDFADTYFAEADLEAGVSWREILVSVTVGSGGEIIYSE